MIIYYKFWNYRVTGLREILNSKLEGIYGAKTVGNYIEAKDQQE